MKILNFFRRQAAVPTRPRAALQAGDGGVIITTPDQLERYLREGGSESSAGAIVTANTAMRVAAVFRCVSIIAGAVANMPLTLKRRVDERRREDASDHALWAVLRRRPNRWQTPSGFRRMLQTHVLLRGNGYGLIERSRGMVRGVLPLDPDRMTVEQLADMSLVYRYTRRDGTRLDLRQDEVFHLIGLSLNGITGLSVVEYARNSIGLAMQTETHGAKLFKNGTTIGSVLQHPTHLGEEGQQNLRESLERFRGAEAAHKTLILEEAMEWKPMGMTSEDAQFLETRQFQRRDIAMFFGVPPHMIGDTEASTSWGTGIEQQSIGFVNYTLQDWLTIWEETIGRDLVAPEEDDLFARFNTAGLLRGDAKSQAEALQIRRRNGVINANEWRALDDLNPREDEGGEEYIVERNMTAQTEGAEQGAEP